MADGGKIDWIASYPKSGNTWLRLMLAAYLAEPETPFDINAVSATRGTAGSRWLIDDLLGMPSSDLTRDERNALLPRAFGLAARRAAAPVWIKVHDRFERLDDGSPVFARVGQGVAVYIVRNPLDVAVSVSFRAGHEGMDRAITHLCDPQATIGSEGGTQWRQFLGDWSGHVASWTDQDDVPVLVLRYEDMLADAARALAGVLAFARPGVPIDQARIAQAVARTEIGSLQRAERSHGFREAPDRGGRFFRSGTAGDWRNHLNADQVDRILAAHGPVMRRFGYSAQ